jgi:hypothetical protein
MQIRPLWPFFAAERLGLGKRDFWKKSTCVSFISGLIFNFFDWYFKVSFEVKKRKSKIPLFSAHTPLFFRWRDRKQRDGSGKNNAIGLQPPKENEETATSIAEASKEDAAFAFRQTFVHANTLKCDEIIRTLPEYKSFQTVIIHISIIIWVTH